MRPIEEVPIYWNAENDRPQFHPAEDEEGNLLLGDILPEDGLNETGALAYPQTALYLFDTEAEANAFGLGCLELSLGLSRDDIQWVQADTKLGWAVLVWDDQATAPPRRVDRRHA